MTTLENNSQYIDLEAISHLLYIRDAEKEYNDEPVVRIVNELLNYFGKGIESEEEADRCLALLDDIKAKTLVHPDEDPSAYLFEAESLWEDELLQIEDSILNSGYKKTRVEYTPDEDILDDDDIPF